MGVAAHNGTGTGDLDIADLTKDQLLEELGLTGYQAKAYRAALELGGGEAKEISTLAPIPRTKIYSILSELHEEGYLSVKAGRPRTYIPVPLHELRESVLHARTRELERTHQVLNLLETRVDSGHSRVSLEPGDWTMYKGRKKCIERLETLAEEAEERVVAHATPPGADRLAYVLQESSLGVKIGEGSVGLSWIIVDDTVALWRALPDDEDIMTGDDVMLVCTCQDVAKGVLAMMKMGEVAVSG